MQGGLLRQYHVRSQKRINARKEYETHPDRQGHRDTLADTHQWAAGSTRRARPETLRPFAFAYGHSRRFHHRRQHRDFHHQRSNAKIHRGVPSHHVGEFAEERANGGRLLQGLRIGSYDTFGRWRRRKQPYNGNCQP